MSKNFHQPNPRALHLLVGSTPVAAAILIALLSPRDAWAYLDPGTGSFALQMAIASSLAALFTVKTWWRQFVLWLSHPQTAAVTATATPIATRRGRMDEPD